MATRLKNVHSWLALALARKRLKSGDLRASPKSVSGQGKYKATGWRSEGQISLKILCQRAAFLDLLDFLPRVRKMLTTWPRNGHGPQANKKYFSDSVNVGQSDAWRCQYYSTSYGEARIWHCPLPSMQHRHPNPWQQHQESPSSLLLSTESVLSSRICIRISRRYYRPGSRLTNE